MNTYPMRTPLLVATLLSVFALTACAGGAATSKPPEATAPGPTAEPQAPTAEPSESGVPTADISEAGLAALVALAAEEAGVAIEEVRVITAEEVTWSDGSLGCPQPGMAYTQALVPGFRVVLEIGGDELSFHAAQGGEFGFCEDPQPPAER